MNIINKWEERIEISLKFEALEKLLSINKEKNVKIFAEYFKSS